MDTVKKVYLLLICQGFYLGSLCQQWTFPSEITALIGSCVEIPCIYHPPIRTSGPPSTVWYLYASLTYPEVLNTKDSSNVIAEYRGRTSLVSGIKSCTLRIYPVKKEDDGRHYYPGIAEDKYTNADNLQSSGVFLSVSDKVLTVFLVEGLMFEGKTTTIKCAMFHTCGSSPPSLQWNKPGNVKKGSEEISGGSWREISHLTFIPSYVDDGTLVQCTATYPNGQIFQRSETLSIFYAPKNVTVTIIGMAEMIEGSDVTLRCDSKSNPDVYWYEWYKGKDKSKLSDRGREITVMNVTRDMEPYSCAAINTVGRRESALTQISVPYAAAGVHIKVKNEPEFTALICDFLSSRPDVTHYTWMKDGSVLQHETGKTLTLYNNEENSGQYSCIAHNSAGDSSSDEFCMKCEDNPVNLPLILGTLAGVFLLLFFILVVYFCLRQKKKSTLPTSPIHGTVPARIPYENMKTKTENQYGNIQPASTRSGPSVDVKVGENYAIYSNSEAMQPSNEIEYCVISHGQHNQTPPTSSRTSHAEGVEYATLRH